MTLSFPPMRETRLYLALIAWSLWMGGFAFYFGVVVPSGGRVIGGSEQGLVTQLVTHRLNLLGVASLVILLWNVLFSKGRLLLGTWALMLMCQIALFAMHSQLDHLIDAQTRVVTNLGRFHFWHEWYETIAAVQWLTGMVHLGAIVFGCRAQWAQHEPQK